MAKFISAHGQRADLSAVRTIAVPAAASVVLLQAFDQNVRITLDGQTSPTTTKGLRITAGDPPLRFPVESGGEIRVLEETATATLDYQFGRGI